MLGVLARAQASKDDDRILAAAKTVLAAHDSSADAQRPDYPDDLRVEELNDDERAEAWRIVTDMKALRARVRARLGRTVDPGPSFVPPAAYVPPPPKPVVVAEPEVPAPVVEPERVEPEPPVVTRHAADILLDAYVEGDDVEFGPPVQVP
jgi:hypothetical protein